MEKTINYYGYSRSEMLEFIPLNVKTVLDIGCGQGLFLKNIKEITNAETWGVEIIPEIAEKATINTDKLLIGKIELLYSEIPDSYFDCILFNDVLEHLIEPTEVLMRIKSKLSDNGIIIASIPNVRFFFNLYELIFKKDWEYKDSGILDSTHLRFFTQKSMKRMFETAGFKLIRQQGINNGVNPLKFALFNLLTFKILSDSKYLQFVCIAQPV
ncbi:MAG: class I SAM-dependent methyltransferase [Mariniphaga sp.]